jgi:hypothetical protein
MGRPPFVLPPFWHNIVYDASASRDLIRAQASPMGKVVEERNRPTLRRSQPRSPEIVARATQPVSQGTS